MTLNRHRHPEVLVVGAGFAGSTVARKVAESGFSVLLLDKRSHIGGNAYDERDRHGLLIHRYGPHIFHTNAKRVVDFLASFTDWQPYEHRVLASINGVFYPIPINQDTVNRLYNLNLSEEGVKQFFEHIRVPFNPPNNSEEVVLNSVGRDLYEKFFYGYTKKQWGIDPSQLSAGVTARIPVRTNRDDHYFSDQYQIMPSEGYTAMFKKMVDHPKIRLELGVDYLAERQAFNPKITVYTGPIDTFFDTCYGALPYRSLNFEHQHIAGTEQFQPVAVVNYPNEHQFTRITEFKHLTGEISSGTSIVREYPTAKGDPYYPIPRAENERLYQRYRQLAGQEKRVIFVGRLAQYRYYNMDQAVAAALETADRVKMMLADPSSSSG